MALRPPTSNCHPSGARRGACTKLRLGSPAAIAMTKNSFLGANGLLLDERQVSMLAHEGWTQRASAEGLEGTAAFREKRKPSWYQPPHPNV